MKQNKFIYIFLFLLILTNLTILYFYFEKSSQNSSNQLLINNLQQNNSLILNQIQELKQNNSNLHNLNLNLSHNLTKSLYRQSNNQELFELYKNRYISCDIAYQELSQNLNKNELEIIYLETSCNYDNYILKSQYDSLFLKSQELIISTQEYINSCKQNLETKEQEDSILNIIELLTYFP